MKFSFCGDLPVPEWFLSQLTLLSNLSFIKVRKLGGLFVQALVEPSLSADCLEKALEILQASDFSEGEAKTLLAMLDFILRNAARNGLEGEQLMKELTDLGIPKENCQSFVKVLDQGREGLRTAFKRNLLRTNRFEGLVIRRWTVLRSSETPKSGQEFFEAHLSTSGSKLVQEPVIEFVMDRKDLDRLNDDVNQIAKLLAELDC